MMMTERTEHLDISNAHRKRHPWQIVGAAVALLLAGQVVYLLFTTPNFGWDVVATYLFEKSIMRGLGMTLLLTVIAMTIGIILGWADVCGGSYEPDRDSLPGSDPVFGPERGGADG